MAQHDQLILLAVLGAVAAFLLLMARQLARGHERPRVPVAPAREDVKPIAQVKIEEPPPPIVEAPEVIETPASESAPKRPRKRRKEIVPVPVREKKNPIDAALALLGERDSLATAFLLREIFAPRRLRRRDRAAPRER